MRCIGLLVIPLGNKVSLNSNVLTFKYLKPSSYLFWMSVYLGLLLWYVNQSTGLRRTLFQGKILDFKHLKFELKKWAMKFETNQRVLMAERILHGGERGLEL